MRTTLPASVAVRVRDILTRLEDEHGPEECWPWPGTLGSGGYGQVGWRFGSWRKGAKGTTMSAHRAAYIVAHGSIGAELVPDHQCFEQACVNPAHLRAVPFGENSGRRRPKPRPPRPAACPAGHPYDEANTYVTPAGSPFCRTCGRERTNRWYAERGKALRTARKTAVRAAGPIDV